MGDYNPAGEPVYLVAKYEEPKKPEPKPHPWWILYLVLIFTFSFVLPNVDTGLVFRGSCYGDLCDRPPEE